MGVEEIGELFAVNILKYTLQPQKISWLIDRQKINCHLFQSFFKQFPQCEDILIFSSLHYCKLNIFCLQKKKQPEDVTMDSTLIY